MMREFKGRQSEILFNDKLFTIVKALEHLIDVVDNPTVGPTPEINSALWLDTQSLNEAELKYYESGRWSPIFEKTLGMIRNVGNSEAPPNPTNGQLWIDNGVLKYFNNGIWIPVKAATNEDNSIIEAFKNFVIIEQLKNSGSDVIDYDFLVGDAEDWKPTTEYKKDTIVYYEEVYYRAKSDFTSGVIFNPTNWNKVFEVWKTNTSYTKDNIVYFVPYYYQCKESHISAASFDINKWAIVPPRILKQFLIPEIKYDRVFINGYHNTDYEVVSNTAIQYETSLLQGKSLSAVHVNPMNLLKMNKRFFAIDSSGIISMPSFNTEFYGFQHGESKTAGTGKLLLKGIDYKEINGGIKLEEIPRNIYDYIVGVTYTFGNTKKSGDIIKGSKLLNRGNSISIGKIKDPLFVSVEGVHIHKNDGVYTYNYADGTLNIELENRVDIMVVSFPTDEHGTITKMQDNNGIVTVTNKFKKPLIFVNNVLVHDDLNEIYDEATNSYRIANAQIGMLFSIFETETLEENMFVAKGLTTVSNGTAIIEYPENAFKENEQPILYVDGICVSTRDIFHKGPGQLACFGLKEGQEFILLNDLGKRLIFDNMVSHTTIVVPQSNNEIVYIENGLINTDKELTVLSLPTYGYDGQILKLYTDSGYKYNKYNSGIRQWEELDEVINSRVIEALESTASQYISGSGAISFLHNFENKLCDYYLFRYANNIECPLLTGKVKLYENKTDYSLNFRHSIVMNKENLSVWINGIRQYPEQMAGTILYKGIKEVDDTTFKIQQGINGEAFYIIEGTEGAEEKSCSRNVLSSVDRVQSSALVYKVHSLNLTNNNLRIFVGGLRIPKESYKIIDNNLIGFMDNIMGGKVFPNDHTKPASKDNPICDIIKTTDGDYKEIQYTREDLILIETRPDLTLREKTVKVRLPKQNEFYIKQDEIPEDILLTNDSVIIYINGMIYTGDYQLDEDSQSIKLLDLNTTNLLGVDPIYEYFLSHPLEYEKWKQKTGNVEYKKKTINDYITFEWR